MDPVQQAPGGQATNTTTRGRNAHPQVIVFSGNSAVTTDTVNDLARRQHGWVAHRVGEQQMPAHVLGRDLVGHARHRTRTTQFDHLREDHVVATFNGAHRALEAPLQGDIIGVHAANQARIGALHQLSEDARDAALTRGNVFDTQARIDHSPARRAADGLTDRRIR